jgi:predicted glycoside hydrolase/deacetylase ChbG (UPF0249 family)
VVLVSTVLERLGYSPDDRVVIVSCDDVGLNHSTNEAVFASLRDSAATSAAVMVPCPWARDAALRAEPGDDLGVHLTLNAEWDRYRWGPITHAPSLVDGDGGFPRTVSDVWDHADLDEVRRELRAQIERAALWGIDVSHLTSHMGSVQVRPEFFDVYLDLAIEYNVPLRLSGASSERALGFAFRERTAAAGVVFPDRLIVVPGVGSRETLTSTLPQLRPGVTELYLHPARQAADLEAFALDWRARVDDDAMLASGDLAALLTTHGIGTTSYATLRELQRAG